MDLGSAIRQAGQRSALMPSARFQPQVLQVIDEGDCVSVMARCRMSSLALSAFSWRAEELFARLNNVIGHAADHDVCIDAKSVSARGGAATE